MSITVSSEASSSVLAGTITDFKVLVCCPIFSLLSQRSSDTKFAEYTPKLAYFFPGQGAQAVGMAKVELDRKHHYLASAFSTYLGESQCKCVVFDN